MKISFTAHFILFITLFSFYSCNSTDAFISEMEHSVNLNYESSLVESRSDNDIAKYIVYKDDSLSIDITIENAIKLGISEKAYRYCNSVLLKQNVKIKEILKNGGKYSFVNCCNDKFKINHIASSNPPFLGAYGHLEYPGTSYCEVEIDTPTNMRGFGFWFNAEVKDKNNQYIEPATALISYGVSGVGETFIESFNTSVVISCQFGGNGENIPFQGKI